MTIKLLISLYRICGVPPWPVNKNKQWSLCLASIIYIMQWLFYWFIEQTGKEGG